MYMCKVKVSQLNQISLKLLAWQMMFLIPAVLKVEKSN